MEDAKDIKEKAYKDYQAGMKYKDIATKYNVSLSAVKSWVSRDWKKLQTKVKKVATEEKKLQPEITPSWPEMEHEYITDIARKPCTLKDLSQKYAIAYGAVRSYAASNNWNEKRKNFKHCTSTKAAEKTTELLSQKIAEARERHFKISDKVIDEIEKSLANEELYTYVEVLRTGYGQGEFADSIEIQTTAVLNDKKLVNIVNALEKIQKIQRAALRETTPMDEHKMRIDSDRLALEKQKANADENANKPIEIIIGKANDKENNDKAD